MIFFYSPRLPSVKARGTGISVEGAGPAGRYARLTGVVRSVAVESGWTVDAADRLSLNQERSGVTGGAVLRRAVSAGPAIGVTGDTPELAYAPPELFRAARIAGVNVEEAPRVTCLALGVAGTRTEAALGVAGLALSDRRGSQIEILYDKIGCPR